MSIYSGIIKAALEAAENADFYPYKIGAVVFKGPKIISIGSNGLRACSRIPSKYKLFENSLHAEQDALSKIGKEKAQGASILVIRLKRNGELSMALPCKMCSKMIKAFGIKKVYYSARDGEIYSYKVKDNDD